MAGNLDKNYDIYDLGLDKNLMRNDSLVLPNSVSQNQSSDNFYGDKFTGGLFDPLDGTYDPQSIRSGELPSLIGHGKKKFTDTVAGLLMGIDTDKIYKWIIGDATSSADWSVTTIGTLTIKGSITATTGTIGGFNIGADYIRDAANSFGLSSTVTGGDDVRFWAGATFANRATATFRITESGILTITNGGSNTLTLSQGSVVGGLIKTASTGARIQISAAFQSTPTVPANSLVLVDSSNNAILEFDSTSGSVFNINPVAAGIQAAYIANVNNSYTAASGSGAAALVALQIVGNASTAIGLSILNNGTGKGMEVTNNTGSSETLRLTNTASGNCLVITKNTNPITAVVVNQQSSADGMFLHQKNSNNTGSALKIYHEGTGAGIIATSVSTTSTQAFMDFSSSANRSCLKITHSSGATGPDVFYIVNSGTGNYINTSGGANLTNGGVWTNASSRKLKENFKEVDYDILEKIKNLEVPLYTYISEKRTKKPQLHLTPMAEDFNSVFGLGDNKTLSAADIAGVALVAIQQLIKKLNI